MATRREANAAKPTICYFDQFWTGLSVCANDAHRTTLKCLRNAIGGLFWWAEITLNLLNARAAYVCVFYSSSILEYGLWIPNIKFSPHKTMLNYIDLMLIMMISVADSFDHNYDAREPHNSQ